MSESRQAGPNVQPAARDPSGKTFEGLPLIPPLSIGMRQPTIEETLIDLQREVNYVTDDWRGRANPVLTPRQLNSVVYLFIKYRDKGKEYARDHQVKPNYFVDQLVDALDKKQTAGGPLQNYAIAWDEFCGNASDEQLDQVAVLLGSVGSQNQARRPRESGDESFMAMVAEPEFFAATALLSFGIVDKDLFTESFEYSKKGDYAGLITYIVKKTGWAWLNIDTFGMAQGYYDEARRNPRATLKQKLWAAVKAPVPIEFWYAATGKKESPDDAPPDVWRRFQLFFEGLLKLAALVGAVKGVRDTVKGEGTATGQGTTPKDAEPATAGGGKGAGGGGDDTDLADEPTPREPGERPGGARPSTDQVAALKRLMGTGGDGARRAMQNFPAENPGIDRATLEWYRDQVARPAIDRAEAQAEDDPDQMTRGRSLSERRADQIDTQQARIELIDRALRQWTFPEGSSGSDGGGSPDGPGAGPAPAATPAPLGGDRTGSGGDAPLQGSTPKDMVRDAIARVRAAAPGERAALWERLARQIEASPQGQAEGWSGSDKHTLPDGTVVFYGAKGPALVFDPEGNVYRGNTTDRAQFSVDKGQLIPHLDKLTKIN